MKFLNKLERKFGRYAIRNLSAYIIALYAAGYLIELFFPEILGWLTLEPYYILHGQVWRILTWLIIPPDSFGFFTIIMLFFYYSLGNTLEQTWGRFRYNVYILGGLLATLIGAFVLYGILYLVYGGPVSFGAMFSTYYVNMSIFLAFAVSYPDMQVLLYFLIPIKIKWMGILYGIFILYSFWQNDWVGRVVILVSLLNFIVYFLATRNVRRVSPKEMKRKQAFRREVHSAAKSGQPRHRCAVCGRTELDDDRLEFRYCSKCDGNYEYCQDHLFTHEHIHKQK
ncbi:MAG TPA: hypothetical protein IAB26_10960 [Candidatus Limivivens merdigallinarum]|uniref:Peptidase S54 rhomboid domain-containing protein n=1 Tax=Candidatus Limivivens merdigallinarum TaxID=2840859 RepID=A0A9D1D1X0_9FIRM|nr:hypothetical protein [Candidatus Limivivens merdigallinarum]